jgi:dTDP-4-dehydrorhamnose 3,5-epimerase
MLRAPASIARIPRPADDGRPMTPQPRQQLLAGCGEILPPLLTDARGSFAKVLREGALDELDANFSVTEIFWTVSDRNVVRGLHFQSPPHAVSKLVWCTRGRAFDVLLDIRRDSATFGQSQAFLLDAAVGNAVFVPVGVAHGFCSLEQFTTISYAQSGAFNAEHDLGIHWSSAQVDWPVASHEAILSDRDRRHPALSEFRSPFLLGS